ncbi:chemotaxis protein [uncultured Helicobacter sp.]|uniref:chemotaxis protein n=1 Tax=uncultured Helicobacter sp. TaxID=175537 RepID=UPI00374EF372
MTQEELNMLMNSDNLDDVVAQDSATTPQSSTDLSETSGIDVENYRVEADKKWPPPPPTEDHKVVHQLDDVTKDSEVKATQIFDQLEIMGSAADNAAKKLKQIKKFIDSQEELFTKLCESFPHVKTFAKTMEDIINAKNTLKEVLICCDDVSDASMQAMDIMQYQDIHRQKIERVINVMRALAQYMNSLFEGKIDDNKRVSSAVYIAGDNKEDIASDDDIEALIASFGNK